MIIKKFCLFQNLNNFFRSSIVIWNHKKKQKKKRNSNYFTRPYNNAIPGEENIEKTV